MLCIFFHFIKEEAYKIKNRTKTEPQFEQSG